MTEHIRWLTGILRDDIHPDTLPEAAWADLLVATNREQMGLPLLAKLHALGFEPPNPEWAATMRRSSGLAALFAAALPQIEAILQPIPTLWLKGLALSHTVYDDPANRAMVDLDVLVPYPERDAALRKLLAAGYQLRDNPDVLFPADDPIRQALSYNYELVGGPGGVVRVELHFRLVSTDDDLLPLDALDWFWGHTMPFTVDGRQYTTLDPAAHLLYLSAHALLQHGETSTLRNFYDIHLLVEKETFAWDVVVAQAAELRWTHTVERALLRSQEAFGTRLPEGIIERLQAARPPDEDITRVTHMQTRGQDWFRFRRWLGLLSWRDRLRFLWGVIFPPPRYMRGHYNLTEGEPLLRWYFHRWGEQFQDVWDDLRKR